MKSPFIVMSFGRWLMAGTLAGGAVLLVSVIILLQSSLHLVAQEANRLDDRRSEEALRAAVALSTEHLASSNQLVSVWDDAVTHVYAAKLDKAWLYSSYGALAKDDSDYDGVYIVDRSGRILWGNAYQSTVAATAIDQVIPRFSPYLNDFAAAKPGAPKAGIFKVDSAILFASVGRIRPSSAAVKAPAGRDIFLVLTRHLNATVFSGYARAYRVKDLHVALSSRSSGGPSIELTNPYGEAVAVLSWTPRKPGQAAARLVEPKIAFSVLIVCVLTLSLFATVVLGLRRLSRSERRARHAATTDALTGLANRGAFMRQLRDLDGITHVLAFLDIDNFKHLNDTYGDSAGDLILGDLAERLKALEGPFHKIARIGGDQFACAVFGEDAEQKMRGLLDMLRQDLLRPFGLAAGQATISLTIGVARSENGKVVAKELCRRCNAALNRAKAQARGGSVYYDGALDRELQYRQDLEREIRDGLERSEFEVFYQPIVGAADNRIESVEALVRWPRRPGGALGPDIFIDVAERSGLIHRLGLFVLRRACRDLRDADGVRLSVNISPAQFHDPEFVPSVRDVLAAEGFPAARLELEITEGYLSEIPAQVEAAIEALRSMGISIALDDFGVGYSSIGYLRRYPFDKLKIDKSLAGTVSTDAKAGALVAATVAIASALNIPVTAEGVETSEQASLLQLAGCKTLQGYLFGKPQSIGDLRRQLRMPAITVQGPARTGV